MLGTKIDKLINYEILVFNNMTNNFTQSIDERAIIAFKKVKRDIMNLNSKVEYLNNNCCNKISKTQFEKLIKRIEVLEKENKELKIIVFNNHETIEEIETSVEKKDLTEIEGIGPVIQGHLFDNNIKTFSQLSRTSITKLKKILEENKLNYHDPSTWPKQAKLAHEGKWEKLRIWQDILIGGKEK